MFCGSLKTSGKILSAKMRHLYYAMLSIVALATLITAVCTMSVVPVFAWNQPYWYSHD